MPNDNRPHAYYCGVDLHARSLFLNICDPAGVGGRKLGNPT